MENHDLDRLRYPIGIFASPETITDGMVKTWIRELGIFPMKLKSLVSRLDQEQLDTPYRPDGWTIRQVVHHISDSHHNSYMRFKWALTEDRPLIKAYDEKAWANLIDSRTGPIQMSLDHLSAVHAKLVFLLKGMEVVALERTFVHPESNEATTLKENVGRYAWHGNHHYAHIRNAMERNGW